MSELTASRSESQGARHGNAALDWVLGILFVGLVVVGWINPLYGYALPVCMLIAMTVAVFTGRKCAWPCARGAFLDTIVATVTRGRPVPKLLRSPGFRVSVMIALFAIFGYEIFKLWGDWVALGGFFVAFLTITTVVAMTLGMIFQPRSWCTVCPIGTLSHRAGREKAPVLISDRCVGCGVCSRACPMGIRVHTFADEGVVTHDDCLRCGVCVAACPMGALSLKSEDRQAA